MSVTGRFENDPWPRGEGGVVFIFDAAESFEQDLLKQAAIAALKEQQRENEKQLHELGVENIMFQPSAFSPRFHHPVRSRGYKRDVAFIGGPGLCGQRARLLADTMASACAVEQLQLAVAVRRHRDHGRR